MQQSRSELFAQPPSLALPVCPPLISRPMSNVIVRSASDESISGGETIPAPGPGAQHDPEPASLLAPERREDWQTSQSPRPRKKRGLANKSISSPLKGED